MQGLSYNFDVNELAATFSQTFYKHFNSIDLSS